MSPFITFKDTDSKDALQMYVCQRAFPHFCAVLSSFPVEGSIAQVPIASYNLWLVCVGTIRGSWYPAYPDIIQMIETSLWEMSNWFYENRIQIDPKRYKKWLIQK